MKVDYSNSVYQYHIGRSGKTICSLVQDSNNPYEASCNETVIVFGGGSGIGLEVCRRFVQIGAKTVIIGRNENKLINAVKKIGSGSISYFVWDVSILDQCKTKFDELINRFGGFELLVNCAGVTGNGISALDFKTADEADFDSCLNTNFKAALYLSLIATNYFSSRSFSGHIINVVSNTAARPAHTPYHISKWMLYDSLSSLAVFSEEKGVYSHLIAPGSVLTDMSWKPGMSVLKLNSPNGRQAHPSEIAELILFVHENKEYLKNGQMFISDGGQLFK